MGFGIRALQKSTVLQRFEFDDQTYLIRRNLMIFSSLAIASTFVSPLNTGKYEINMGIIKGVINDPVLLYLFLAITCTYYLIWFYIHCQRLVVRNYNNIKQYFIESLTKINAEEKFRIFAKEFEPKFSGTPSFTTKRRDPEAWEVRANVTNHAIRNHPEMVKNLQENSEFFITKTGDGMIIDYTHINSSDDLSYLNTHLDQYWRTRKEEWFIAVLPIVYSILSIVLIGFHIYGLYKS